jgi:hypothetical protein
VKPGWTPGVSPTAGFSGNALEAFENLTSRSGQPLKENMAGVGGWPSPGVPAAHRLSGQFHLFAEGFHALHF